LLALFWPDCGATHARDALNQSLRFLRRFLGKDVLISRGDDELGVDMTRLWCDAAAFDQRIAAGDDVDALSLYRGNLLEGVLSRRRRSSSVGSIRNGDLHEQACNAAGRLTARCEAMGDLTGGLQWARRAIGLSPYDEVAFRRLLDLLDRSGDRARAVREYALFATRLREELEVEPSPETQAAVEGIRARATPNELLPSAPAASAVTTVPTKHVSEAEVDWSPRRHRLVPRVARFAAPAALPLLAGAGVSIIAKELRPRAAAGPRDPV
jgi:DNA-binding SARP family transcriptional activator